ncbi:EF2563 family selenium-dependent molybdenum hydroxylase system protein [Treponema medium]|uniref:YqeB family selenium-dependent molybdenum hydroxylase system protein n=2 Tax=Treponema medium TaxID=58231 RepID=A0AA87NR25_TREMD|nr:YqeB family selenium-dependent molybdenum hydroxylase system protein [Treponema medium ATCC 700293]QSH97081.1 EF2563 family selenium-dependent molybdenum hydroxylase system protein [Treponema medium]
MKQSAPLIIVRGAGDLASGVLAAIHICGFRVLALETANPSAIRRTVAFSEAVRLGHCTIEGIEARLIAKDQVARILSAKDSESDTQSDTEAITAVLSGTEVIATGINTLAAETGAAAGSKANRLSFIPIAVDPTGELIGELQPAAVVDAIIAKKNCGTHLDMAPLVIALGPGFTAGKDAHIVIETMRGHNLARLIYQGAALPNTGVPGLVGGESALRVIHAPAAGTLRVMRDIGESVTRGETIARIIHTDGSVTDVAASLNGIIRGMLPDGFVVHSGLKMADIDPRLTELNNCFTISDKARSLGGAVLTALLSRGIVP